MILGFDLAILFSWSLYGKRTKNLFVRYYDLNLVLDPLSKNEMTENAQKTFDLVIQLVKDVDTKAYVA